MFVFVVVALLTATLSTRPVINRSNWPSCSKIWTPNDRCPGLVSHTLTSLGCVTVASGPSARSSPFTVVLVNSQLLLIVATIYLFCFISNDLFLPRGSFNRNCS